MAEIPLMAAGGAVELEATEAVVVVLQPLLSVTVTV
jgi:hypothetical protein